VAVTLLGEFAGSAVGTTAAQLLRRRTDGVGGVRCKAG
jgi:hypothetical protein